MVSKLKVSDVSDIPITGTDFVLDRSIVDKNFGEIVHKNETFTDSIGEIQRTKLNDQKDMTAVVKVQKWLIGYLDNQLTDKYYLVKRDFPEDCHLTRDEQNCPRIPIYFSYDFCREDLSLNRGKKCMLLIQGPGMQRMGQWTRPGCYKQNLKVGTMLPYVDAARRSGWGVIIANPNTNKEQGMDIAHSTTPDLHIWHIWKDYIVPSQFDQVHIVVQGMAGDSLNTIQYQEPDQFYGRVKKIAYCEAVTMPYENMKDNERKFMLKSAIHLNLSEKDVGTSMRPTSNDSCVELSGGTTVPGDVAGTAFERVMHHFDLKDWKKKPLPK